jgi:hypothetical protein
MTVAPIFEFLAIEERFMLYMTHYIVEKRIFLVQLGNDALCELAS